MIFTLAGLGMHQLVPGKSEWARYAAGILYVVNPFTYSRLMTGQYLVLAGYALMPWFVGSLLKFIRAPGKGSALRLTAWAAAIGFMSIHFLGFAFMIAAIALILGLVRAHRAKQPLKPLLGWSVAALAGLLIINSFWLLPALTGHSAQAQTIGGFDIRDALSFRTDSDPAIGQVGNTLSLHGMWTDREGLYRSSKPAWWLVALGLIWGVAIIGAIKYRRRYGLETALLAITATVATILAQGVMGSPFAALNQWLFDQVPFFAGYREPGKFIGLIALTLAWCFGLGAGWIIERLQDRRWGDFLPPLLVALPLLYTPTMLWGAGGQLKAVDYPADWYALNHTLDAQTGEGRVLFLPWHQYLYFDFAGRLIANPASRFFDRPTIQGDNAEIGLIESQSHKPDSLYIEQQVLVHHTDTAAKLRHLGIKYVVLAKTADYKDYGWLSAQSGLRLISDTATIKVYEVSP